MILNFLHRHFVKEPDKHLWFIVNKVRELKSGWKQDFVFAPSRGQSGGDLRGIFLGNDEYFVLAHELGHSLMFGLYNHFGAGMPDYAGEDHDTSSVALREQATSPGAAWSEGFASAVADLANDVTPQAFVATQPMVNEHAS